MEKAHDKVNGRGLVGRMAKPDPDRAARLAEALRVNLRRRKAQARAQAEAAPEAEPASSLPEEPSPH